MKNSNSLSKNLKKLKLQYNTIETPTNKKNLKKSQKINKTHSKPLNNNINLQIPESPNASDFMIHFNKNKKLKKLITSKIKKGEIKFISNNFTSEIRKNQIQNINQSKNNLSISHLTNNSINDSGIKLILDFSVNHSNEEIEGFLDEMKEEKKVEEKNNNNKLIFGNQMNHEPSNIELIINDEESFYNNQPIIPLSTMNKSESEEPLIDGGKILNYDKKKLMNLEKLLKKSNQNKYKTHFDNLYRKDSLFSNNSESSYEKNLKNKNVPVPMENNLKKKKKKSKERKNILKQRFEREKKIEEEQNVILNQLDTFLNNKSEEEQKIEKVNEKAEDSDDEEEDEKDLLNDNNNNINLNNKNLLNINNNKQNNIIEKEKNENLINTAKTINPKYINELNSSNSKDDIPGEIDKEIKEVSKVKKNIKEIENYYENEIKRINFKLNQMGQNDEPSKEKIKIIKEKFIQLDNLYSKQENEYISTIIELMEELKNLNGGIGISNKLIKEIDSLIIDRNNEENKNTENNDSEIINRKSIEKELLEELENFKKEEKIYKFKIPSKYQMNNSIRCLKQTVVKGKIIKFYENSVIDLINRHRTIKRIFPDGYEICYYNNKDVKQKFSDGRIYFYYNLNKSCEFRFFNQSFVVYKFISGQFEKHYFDHSKSVKYTDGTYRITSSKGGELIQFPDGNTEFRDKKGNLL